VKDGPFGIRRDWHDRKVPLRSWRGTIRVPPSLRLRWAAAAGDGEGRASGVRPSFLASAGRISR